MRRLTVAAAALLMLVAACGDDDSGGVTTTAAPGTTSAAGASTTTGLPGETSTTLPSGDGGGCIVEVTGDIPTSWSGPGGVSAFTSDYWYTEDELRQQFAFFTDPEGRTFEQVYEAGEAIFTFFLMNCQGPGGELVTLAVSDDATRADFPFATGTYPVKVGMFSFDGDQQGPSDFAVLFAINDTDVWGLDGEGRITIDRWDGETVAGTFAFDVIEQFVTTGARRGSVTGSFEMTCQASVQC